MFLHKIMLASQDFTHTHTSSGVKMKLWHVFKDVEPKKRKKSIFHCNTPRAFPFQRVLYKLLPPPLPQLLNYATLWTWHASTIIKPSVFTEKEKFNSILINKRIYVKTERGMNLCYVDWWQRYFCEKLTTLRPPPSISLWWCHLFKHQSCVLSRSRVFVLRIRPQVWSNEWL